jgi:hypothetical protein
VSKEGFIANMAAPDLAVEELATLLHESGRDAVQRNLLLNREELSRPFVEWDDLPDHAREGRRVQARFLIAHAGAVRACLP